MHVKYEISPLGNPHTQEPIQWKLLEAGIFLGTHLHLDVTESSGCLPRQEILDQDPTLPG